MPAPSLSKILRQVPDPAQPPRPLLPPPDTLALVVPGILM
jgi:hypothetical protein